MTPKEKLSHLKIILNSCERELKDIEDRIIHLNSSKEKNIKMIKQLKEDINLCSTVADQYDRFEQDFNIKAKQLLRVLDGIK